MQKWILEGAKIKYFGRLNTSLEGAELFGPPKIRAQLRLWKPIFVGCTYLSRRSLRHNKDLINELQAFFKRFEGFSA